MAPTVEEELRLHDAGHRRIAGVDEVGRGCWAGPVVAAAVVLPPAVLAAPALLAGVDDSKALAAARREQLAERILALADDWGLGVVPAHVIDTHGILAATRLAMQVALLRLARPADALLIDAVRLEFWGCPQRALIKGDARCLSIAAASIVAKVARDRMMCALDRQLPRYGFAMHKGYGTALHERALRALGPSPQHRRSFQPIAEFVATGAWPARRRAAEPGPEAAVYA
ncbi:ribonuclease HII [Kouleothrix sp.]|uniref:ribonuclease HII n=1 Tax=Kouleothrix sp. TaxID=2779161 RepID=UPI00391AFEC9